MRCRNFVRYNIRLITNVQYKKYAAIENKINIIETIYRKGWIK